MTTQIDQQLPRILIDDSWEPPPRPSHRAAVIITTAVLVLAGALFVSIRSGIWEQGWPEGGTAQATQPYSASTGRSRWYPDSEAISVNPPPPSSRPAVQPPSSRPAVQPPRVAVRTRTSAAPPMRPTASAPGYFAVNTTPWAELSVDGRVVGNTPQLQVRVTPGWHQLVLAREGFQAETTWVSVEPGATVKITGISMKRIAP